MKTLKMLAFGLLFSVGGFLLLTGLTWLIATIIPWDQAGYSLWHGYVRGWVPTVRSGQVLWLLWTALCFAAAGLVFGPYADSDDTDFYRTHSYHEEPEPTTTTAEPLTWISYGIAIVAACLTLLLFTFSLTVDNKLEPKKYLTSVSVEYDKRPQILDRLLAGGHDLQPTIVGDKPIEYLAAGFDERPASLVGAQKIMSERSTGDSRAEVLDETLAYLPAESGTGRWTAIRDGEGKRVHIDSIVEWDGAAEHITQCRFKDANELNYAVTGSYSNSLADVVRARYDGMYWALSDAYGFCDADNAPVIVLPMKMDAYSGARTVEVPAGVITVRGSQSGEAVIEYLPSVSKGQIPGPVYPLSIAAKQREAINWSAGHKWADSGFGFEPVKIASNEGNQSEYVLRSMLDESTYYVTPLTARDSKSEAIVAASFIASNSVTKGQLNLIRVQVHQEDEEGILTEQDLERRARDILRAVDPAFLNKGQDGELQEFIPAADGTWAAFAVQSGQPRYLLRIRPGQLDQAVELNGGEIGQVLAESSTGKNGTTSTPTVKPGDTADLATLSEAELQAQLDAAWAELDRLHQEDIRRRTPAG